MAKFPFFYAFLSTFSLISEWQHGCVELVHIYLSEGKACLRFGVQISHKKKQCVKFRAKQKHMVENLQPAKVQVYDYYNPGRYDADNLRITLSNI